jgi:hypothetical protein
MRSLLFLAGLGLCSPFLWKYIRSFNIRIDYEATLVASLIDSEDEQPFHQNFKALLQKIRDEDTWVKGELEAGLSKMSESLNYQISPEELRKVVEPTSNSELQEDILTNTKLLETDSFREVIPEYQINQIIEVSSNSAPEELVELPPPQLSSSSTSLSHLSSQSTYEHDESDSTDSESTITYTSSSSSATSRDFSAVGDVKEITETTTQPPAPQSKIRSSKPEEELKPSKTTSSVIKEGMNVSPDEFSALRQLGYGRTEIMALKPTVRKLILQNAVQRPNKGSTGNITPLPPLWLQSQYRGTETVSKKTSTSESQKRKQETLRDITNQKKSEPSSQIPPKKKVSDENIGSESRSVNWRGIDPVDLPVSMVREEQDNADKDGQDAALRRLRDESLETPSSSSLTVWPERDEFKDMLINESRFRVNVMGDWIVPYLRKENKWRLQVYDQWLNFLQEGFGDVFDVVDEDFQEDRASDKQSSVFSQRGLLSNPRNSNVEDNTDTDDETTQSEALEPRILKRKKSGLDETSKLEAQLAAEQRQYDAMQAAEEDDNEDDNDDDMDETTFDDIQRLLKRKNVIANGRSSVSKSQANQQQQQSRSKIPTISMKKRGEEEEMSAKAREYEDYIQSIRQQSLRELESMEDESDHYNINQLLRDKERWFADDETTTTTPKNYVDYDDNDGREDVADGFDEALGIWEVKQRIGMSAKQSRRSSNVVSSSKPSKPIFNEAETTETITSRRSDYYKETSSSIDNSIRTNNQIYLEDNDEV